LKHVQLNIEGPALVNAKNIAGRESTAWCALPHHREEFGEWGKPWKAPVTSNIGTGWTASRRRFNQPHRLLPLRNSR